MMQTAITIVFWVCIGAVVYTWAVYPLLIWLLSRLFGRTAIRPRVENDQLPTLSLLIAAHNEEAVINRRIANAMALDYPAGKLQIVIACDGSDDATAAIVRRWQSVAGATKGVTRCQLPVASIAGSGGRQLVTGNCLHHRLDLLDFRVRRGKAATLNAAIPLLQGEVVMLSDANTELAPDSARRLAAWFVEEGSDFSDLATERRSDEGSGGSRTSSLTSPSSIGVVCGRLVLVDGGGRNVDGVYWRYETFLKCCESRLGALLGANGAVYAIRRRLCEPLPPGTILDDFLLPLRAKLRHGCAIVYDDEAVGSEETAPALAGEFRRRCRIGAGGAAAIAPLWRLLDLRRGWIALSFFSHKLLRWICPVLLLGALVTNLMLIDQSFYALMLMGQAGFFLAALLGAVAPAGWRWFRPLRVAAMFAGMNAALLVGWLRFLRGRANGIWQPEARMGIPSA